MCGSFQAAPESFGDVSAASNDKNQNDQFPLLQRVADAPAADANAPDRSDAPEFPRAVWIGFMRQGRNRVRQSQ